MRDDVVLRDGIEGPVLDQFLLVLDTINRRDIRYCYWKSSRRLPAALAGDTDLDLLVARQDQHGIQECLLAAGFKMFPSVPHRSDCSTLSYLGHDEPSGRILNIHLHIQLVSGNRLLLDYHLPWEEKILSRSIPHSSFPIQILDPATEALLLIIRGCLELRRDDPVIARNWTAAREKFEADRRALAMRVDRQTLQVRAVEFLGNGFAQLVVDALTSEKPLDKQAGFRRLVRQRLSPYRCYNPFEARVRGAVRAAYWALGALNQRHLHLPRGWNRRTPGGGVVVALMGVDGSGKSTAVAALRQWLGAEVDVMPIYFGTGDGRPSLLLWPLKLLVPLFTSLGVSKPKGSSHGKVTDHAPGLVYSLLLTIWSTALAIEKRKKLRQARRAADRGLVVIADRYPQDQLAAFNDGPLLPRLRRVPQWLRNFEANAYQLANQLPPDLVIKLTANPELIATREPTMNREVISERVKELAMLAFPNSPVVSINAAQPLATVLRQIKREVWQRL